MGAETPGRALETWLGESWVGSHTGCSWWPISIAEWLQMTGSLLLNNILGRSHPPGMQLWVVGKQVGRKLGPPTGFSGWGKVPGSLSKLTYSGFVSEQSRLSLRGTFP